MSRDYLTDQPPANADLQRPTPEFLLWAYAHGAFPMADARSRGSARIEWYCPDPRGVIPLAPPEAFHVPRNLAREVRAARFQIRSDTAFQQVIRSCAQPRSSDNLSWLSPELMSAYIQLHARGHAHSLEAWRDGALVGGLYGVHIGGAFFGESMFSAARSGGSNSSKVCLVHLVSWLRRRGFRLLDTQFYNRHLAQFGCVEVPAHMYLAELRQAIRQPVTWGEFDPVAVHDSRDAARGG